MESVEDDDIALEPDQPPKSSATGSTPTQRPSKKRTKTGCITCRKRRIKCGEERPTCKNCIKSKRDCGGYIQPLTFKQPNGDIRIPGNDPGGVYHGTIGSGIPPNHYQPSYHLSHIQPLPNYNTAHVHHSYPDPRFDTSYNDHGSEAVYGYPNMLRTSLHGAESPMWTWSAPNNTSFNQEPQVRKNWPQQPTESSRLHDFHTTNTGVSTGQSHPYSQPAFSRPHHSMSSAGLSVATETLAEQYDNRNWSANHTRTPSTLQSSQLPSSTVSASSEKHHFETWDLPQTDDPNSFRRPHLNRGATMPINVEYGPQKHEAGIDYEQGRRYSVHGFVQRPSFDTQIPTSKAELPSAPVVQGQSAEGEEEEEEEEDDDDPYDVEMQFDEQASASTEQTQQELSTMLVRYAAQDDRQTRTFTTYLDSPNVLATYKPSHSASPLYDDRVGRIFCHFVSVTGPCLSLYERQAANSPITFSGLAVPSSQKMLWTYTLPSLAIHHPALLHALLALSSLHIAKIQKTSEDSSLKHFTYAVRRVGKLLGLPKRRHEIATLATILLLGFYEVMSADHSRWNLHLAGAKDLVMEFDFAGMARTTKRMRSQAKANFAQRFASSYEEHVQIAGIPETLLNDVDWEIDEGLVSQLTGFHIEYENQWQPNFRRQQQHQELTAKDVEDYKTKSDLRWWYCKQDVFQSMVSGDPLLMPYDQWIYCPPRGQIGKTNAAYASMDHLCLIMARLTDFGGKDRARKQRVVAALGGQWRPPPDFSGHRRQPLETQSPLKHSTQSHQSTQTPHIRAPNGLATHPGPGHMPSGQPRSGSSSMPPPSNPSFYGMMPLPTEPIEMHSAFETMNANLRDPAFNRPMPVPEPTQDQDLDFETTAALTEHAAIVKAFDLFAESLGPEFERLPADTNPPISTPFGPAIQYRTYPIACVWAFYHVGRILVHRMHPYMSPAAMVSAGFAADLTKDYAQTVGKICAGLYAAHQPNTQNPILNPYLGAALMETTFYLLFAAIQYQDAAQRGWTISKLNDIAEMTGWQTSASVAAACEVVWHKMGAAGRGPPYTITMDENNKDVRVRNMFGRNSARGNVEKVPEAKVSEKQEQPAFLSHDRVLIDRNPASRVHWALGLLSVEEDIAKLNLGKQ